MHLGIIYHTTRAVGVRPTSQLLLQTTATTTTNAETMATACALQLLPCVALEPHGK